jgi:hypothetical protein
VEDYIKTTAFSGPAERVLAAAITTLTNNGFAIVDRSDVEATLVGPGFNSTRQNPLVGASQIKIAARSHTLHVTAELGGVESMRRFLMRFPFLLGLGLGAFFAVFGGVLFGQLFGVGFGVPGMAGWRWAALTLAMGMLPSVPWIVISPMMIRRIRERTHRALDVLVSNSTFASRAA